MAYVVFHTQSLIKHDLNVLDKLAWWRSCITNMQNTVRNSVEIVGWCYNKHINAISIDCQAVAAKPLSNFQLISLCQFHLLSLLRYKNVYYLHKCICISHNIMIYWHEGTCRGPTVVERELAHVEHRTRGRLHLRGLDLLISTVSTQIDRSTKIRSKMLWSTVSKAADRTSNINAIAFRSSMMGRMSFLTRGRAVSVLCRWR